MRQCGQPDPDVGPARARPGTRDQRQRQRRAPLTVFRTSARDRQAPVQPSGLLHARQGRELRHGFAEPQHECEPHHAPAARGQPSRRSHRQG
eukprot:7104782-Alexandrium_andersonii.AAC.1